MSNKVQYLSMVRDDMCSYFESLLFLSPKLSVTKRKKKKHGRIELKAIPAINKAPNRSPVSRTLANLLLQLADPKKIWGKPNGHPQKRFDAKHLFCIGFCCTGNQKLYYKTIVQKFRKNCEISCFCISVKR